jgi:hypothetical protein
MADSMPGKDTEFIHCRTGRANTFTWPNTIGRNGMVGGPTIGTNTIGISLDIAITLHIIGISLDITTTLYIIGTSQHTTATTLQGVTQTHIIPSIGP